MRWNVLILSAFLLPAPLAVAASVEEEIHHITDGILSGAVTV
jgi:hypothetical protein